MGTITLVIKKPDEIIESVEINSTDLPELVNDVRLYQKDMEFIESFINKANNKTVVLPSDDGIIIIDMVDNNIYDSQGYTGIFKITPSELKSSKTGNVVGETSENNTVKRFIDAVKTDRLRGFESWHDSGTTMNTEIANIDDFDTLLETSGYGQFVFDTTPFRVTTFYKVDAQEQGDLFGILSRGKYLDDESILLWLNILDNLKYANR